MLPEEGSLMDLHPVIAQGSTQFVVGGAIIAFIVLLVLVAVFARFLGLWIQCLMTGAKIGLLDLFFMSIRKVNPTVIVRAKIMAVQAGITDDFNLSTRDLESHYLAGGKV